MLNEFFTWWGTTLLELLPARLAGSGSGRAGALLVTPLSTPAAPRYQLALRTARGTRTLGTFDLAPGRDRALQSALRTRPRATILQLPPHLVLGRDLVLPLATERRLPETLAFELDRLTPFRPEELYWTSTILRRDRARARLHLHLALVPRTSIQPILDQLAPAGLTPTALEAAPTPGDTPAPALRIPLQPATPGNPRLGQALAALCALLLIASVSTPFILQSIDAARTERRIAALRPQVDAVDAIRRRAAAAAAGVDVIAAERLRLGDTLAVLAALTDLLPDDTSLTELTLHQGRLTIGGQSAAAPRLIAALSADPLIRNPDFAAPVTRLNDGRADLFSIRAEVAP